MPCRSSAGAGQYESSQCDAAGHRAACAAAAAANSDCGSAGCFCSCADSDSGHCDRQQCAQCEGADSSQLVRHRDGCANRFDNAHGGWLYDDGERHWHGGCEHGTDHYLDRVWLGLVHSAVQTEVIGAVVAATDHEQLGAELAASVEAVSAASDRREQRPLWTERCRQRLMSY